MKTQIPKVINYYLILDENEAVMSVIASSPTIKLSDPLNSSIDLSAGAGGSGSGSAGGALGSGFITFSGSPIGGGTLNKKSDNKKLKKKVSQRRLHFKFIFRHYSFLFFSRHFSTWSFCWCISGGGNNRFRDTFSGRGYRLLFEFISATGPRFWQWWLVGF